MAVLAENDALVVDDALGLLLEAERLRVLGARVAYRLRDFVSRAGATTRPNAVLVARVERHVGNEELDYVADGAAVNQQAGVANFVNIEGKVLPRRLIADGARVLVKRLTRAGLSFLGDGRMLLGRFSGFVFRVPQSDYINLLVGRAQWRFGVKLLRQLMQLVRQAN